ncbi:MAG: aminopeptidase, partial [Sphaerochaetaceae bacterium]
MNQQEIDRYADLIITKGINLQRGKGVAITTGPGTYYFARALSKSAYRHGASYVQVLLDDLDVLSERLTYQEGAELTFNPHFMKAFDYEFIAEGWSFIRIDSTEERLDHGSIDGEKNQILGKAKRQFSEARQKKLMSHQLPWCVCVAPGPRWAKQLLGEEATAEDLFKVLKPILLLDTPDPQKAWDEKKALLKQRQNYLNGLEIDTLHYTSDKADLVIGFTDRARFVGGGEALPDGNYFFPNLPTEEIFTTPDNVRAEGYITTTRPVEVLNTTTEEVRFEFKDGKIVGYSAKKGKEALDRFFSIDEGTKRLGEVALVDETSPIAKSNLVFNSILLDENASCHLALGEGYPTALNDGENLETKEQLER